MADSRPDSGRAAGAAAVRQKAKPPSPWSVRGVSREARAKAGKAASRRRETIGEWVTNALTQVANEELGSGPRSEQVQNPRAGLPTGINQDETPLGKALLALAERFERSEKRNDAIASLAERMEGAENNGRDVSVMAQQIGIVEQRSRALTLLVDRLESAERRENSLLTLMHGVAERAERGEERIAAVTRGLADLALNLEAALNRNSAHTAQTISNSMAPLENAVNTLGKRLPSASSTAPAATAPAATAAASAQFYGDPAAPEAAPEAQPATPGDFAGGDVAGDDSAAGGKERGGRLKFDFAALKQHAINNSQRLAQDLDEPAEGERPARGGWFGNKPDSGGQDGAEAGAGDNWESAYVAPDGARDGGQESARNGLADGPQEPNLGEPGEEKKPARGGWFRRKSKSESADRDGAEASAGDDWASEYLAPDGAQDGAQGGAKESRVDGPQEPTLDSASPAAAAPVPAPDPAPAAAAPQPAPAPDPSPPAPSADPSPDATPAVTPVATPTAEVDAAPAVSEEDEMLMALKQAIRPEKP